MPESRIQQPRTISLAPGWLFDADDYERLRLGHEPTGDSDAWACYLSAPIPAAPAGTFHAHRVATGREMYRLPLDGDGVLYLAREFTVEQDPARYRLTDAEEIRRALADLLTNVVQAPPMLFD